MILGTVLSTMAEPLIEDTQVEDFRSKCGFRDVSLLDHGS